MAEIVPTVLCENAEDYKLTIERLSPFAKRVHLDLADGEFAPTKTVELSEMWWPQDWQVDIHAMVARPSLYVDALVQMRPSLVIFHAEVDEDLQPSIQQLKASGIQTGVGLLRRRCQIPSKISSAQLITCWCLAVIWATTAAKPA